MFKHEKKPDLLINLCLGMLVFCCSTVVFSTLNGLTFDVKDGLDAIGGGGSAGNVYQIASDYFYDLYYVDQSGSDALSSMDYENERSRIPQYRLNREKLGAININDVLDYDSEHYSFNDPNAKDILSQRIFMMGDGEYELLELADGVAWTDAGNEFYYRYKVDWLPMLVELIAIIIVYVAMAWKCAKIAYELAFARCLAFLYSAEVSGGQKLGKILVFIRDSYILMLLTTLSLKLFYFINAYIENHIDNDIVVLFLFAFSAFAVIDGPNLVEQLFGMDVGLQSSTARMVAAYGFVKGAGRVATAPARAGGSFFMQQWNNRKLAALIGKATGNGSADDKGAPKDSSQSMDTSFMNGNEGEHPSGGANGKAADGFSENADKDTGIPPEENSGSNSAGYNTAYMDETSEDAVSALGETSFMDDADAGMSTEDAKDNPSQDAASSMNAAHEQMNAAADKSQSKASGENKEMPDHSPMNQTDRSKVMEKNDTGRAGSGNRTAGVMNDKVSPQIQEGKRSGSISDERQNNRKEEFSFMRENENGSQKKVSSFGNTTKMEDSLLDKNMKKNRGRDD